MKFTDDETDHDKSLQSTANKPFVLHHAADDVDQTVHNANQSSGLLSEAPSALVFSNQCFFISRDQ